MDNLMSTHLFRNQGHNGMVQLNTDFRNDMITISNKLNKIAYRLWSPLNFLLIYLYLVMHTIDFHQQVRCTLE